MHVHLAARRLHLLPSLLLQPRRLHHPQVLFIVFVWKQLQEFFTVYVFFCIFPQQLQVLFVVDVFFCICCCFCLCNPDLFIILGCFYLFLSCSKDISKIFFLVVYVFFGTCCCLDICLDYTHFPFSFSEKSNGPHFFSFPFNEFNLVSKLLMPRCQDVV